MSPTPTKIRLDKPRKLLVVEWSDGLQSDFAWSFLRSQCPSADIAAVRPVGSYAINITWTDGHGAGIYTWEYLRRLHLAIS